jgi:2-polyprenyl-3-methyl-5-hydroxy-6-metoxy-1,4-benzoquinol methylase
MSSNVNPYNGIWSLEIAARRHKCDLMLAAIIGMTFSPKSTADIGCGNGQYCAILKAYGWKDVVGYEGTKNVTSLGYYNDIRYVDLTQKLLVANPYDLVLCLEVGEHIPPQHEQIFLDNLCKFASNDMVLSWAPHDQYSASGHVNCQKKEYIISEVEKRGFKFNSSKTNFIMEYASFPWFRRNLMVFKKQV